MLQDLFQAKRPSQTPMVAMLKTELSYLDLESPKNDLDKNIAHRDFRFICVYGVSIVCPGTKGPDYIQEYGSRMIEGTTDTAEGEEHHKLQGIAFVYAEKYNQLLMEKISRLQKEGNKPNKTVVF
ncbi:MAG: hypothetical protein OEY35_06710 [Gammaproteobacteria bacterium]|nr:hypothetical protein [Gammaproteobacteria bacterium]MDH5614706.1 hypothetical protein [Gammaproteobacteria bacterium]